MKKRVIFKEPIKDGTKFHDLEVVGIRHKSIENVIYYVCKCICGKRITVKDKNLLDNIKKDCGCKEDKPQKVHLETNKKYPPKLKQLEDGQKFGRLSILKYKRLDDENNELYLCKCDCGRVLTVSRLLLKDKEANCGCLFKEKMAEDNGKTFNRLTILKFSHLEKEEEFVVCKCRCSKRIILPRKEVKSCQISGCGTCISHTRKRLESRKPISVHSLKNRVMKAYRKGAKDRGHEFNLERDDFHNFLTMNCYYCNSEPSNTIKQNSTEVKYNGIDRVDSTKGYSIDNCVSCCATCNRAKRIMTVKEFLEWVSRVYKHSIDSQISRD